MEIKKAIYFFAPTAKNIAKFETIDDTITLQIGYYFKTQLVKIGDTKIKTNFFNHATQEIMLAIIQIAYYCTGFDFDPKNHDFMMSFDDVHYFDNQQDAENFKNGIN